MGAVHLQNREEEVKGKQRGTNCQFKKPAKIKSDPMCRLAREDFDLKKTSVCLHFTQPLRHVIAGVGDTIGTDSARNRDSKVSVSESNCAHLLVSDC